MKVDDIIGGADGQIQFTIEDNSEFLEYASSQIKANDKSFFEFEDYLIKKHNAVLFEPSDIEKEMFLESLTYSSNINLDKLDIKAYKLISDIKNDIIIQVEVNSCYLRIVNGNDKLFNDIIIYIGVTEKDIDMKTPRFISYAYAMKSVGKI